VKDFLPSWNSISAATPPPGGVPTTASLLASVQELKKRLGPTIPDEFVDENGELVAWLDNSFPDPADPLAPTVYFVRQDLADQFVAECERRGKAARVAVATPLQVETWRAMRVGRWPGITGTIPAVERP